MHAPTARTTVAPAAILASLLAVSACGASGSDAKSATGAGGDPHTATVTVTAANGCEIDRTTFDAGGLTFNVRNQDATGVSEVELVSNERIVGEKENLPPGFSGTFAAEVEAGGYTLYCPGAKVERTPLTVTGAAASSADDSTAALLATGSKQYAAYVDTQVGTLVQTTQALSAAIKSGDLESARTAYKKARPYYERIEPVAESFTVGSDDLDAAIDARQGDVPDNSWTGFHRIEKGLFADDKLDGLAPLGDGLVANTRKLQTLTKGLAYKPAELANGAQELLDEVAATKVTGEEERYSHIDLLDFGGNVEGAEQAFADLLPGLKQIDPALAENVRTSFASLDSALDKYRSSTDASGFVLYSTLTNSDKQRLAAAVKAVQEPLSRVASKVAGS